VRPGGGQPGALGICLGRLCPVLHTHHRQSSVHEHISSSRCADCRTAPAQLTSWASSLATPTCRTRCRCPTGTSCAGRCSWPTAQWPLPLCGSHEAIMFAVRNSCAASCLSCLHRYGPSGSSSRLNVMCPIYLILEEQLMAHSSAQSGACSSRVGDFARAANSTTTVSVKCRSGWTQQAGRAVRRG
jgi:hypothetical protein